MVFLPLVHLPGRNQTQPHPVKHNHGDWQETMGGGTSLFLKRIALSTSDPARRSVFQIGGARIRAESESLKNLGVQGWSPRKNFSNPGLFFMAKPFCECLKVILCSEVLIP